MALMIHGDRVRDRTAPEVLDRIDAEIEARVDELARSPRFVEARLRELDDEWDIERWLEVSASALAATGSVLGVRRRVWTLLPLTVMAFLLQHAVSGWCPPVALLRRLGVRTQREIDAERTALKAIRGDFVLVESTESSSRGVAALSAATV